jgi:hypothetical protein
VLVEVLTQCEEEDNNEICAQIEVKLFQLRARPRLYDPIRRPLTLNAAVGGLGGERAVGYTIIGSIRATGAEVSPN